jgi:hypothetical protein
MGIEYLNQVSYINFTVNSDILNYIYDYIPHILKIKGMISLRRLFTAISILLIAFFCLYLIAIAVSQISWKIYILIYSNYLWGLLFPYAKYSSVLICVIVIFLLLILCVIKIIGRRRRHYK